jgi:hypothetical protein
MGMFLSQVHAIFPKVLAIPLGPVAIVCALIAAWRISRKRGVLGGGGLAVWGGLLGFAGMILTFSRLSNPRAQQVDQDQWRQQQGQYYQNMVRRHGGPKGNATNFTSNLPIIVLNGDPQFASKHNDVMMRAQFFDVGNAGNSKRAALAGKAAHEGLITIHPRGSSTLNLPKHSYTMHTIDAQTNDLKVALFGLPKDDAWVLYAPFEDKTMIRDVLAYQLSNQMGEYAPRTRYVEVFVHNSRGPVSMNDYEGVYVLIEKIKRGKERVNIAKLGPEDSSEPNISGGYIVKRDHDQGSGKRFHTEHGGPYFFVYPNERNITREQRAWLTQYFNRFEEALYSDDFKDPKRGYAAYLDTAAFIDMHWLIEMSKNIDAFRYSAYLTKDRGGKIKAGPAWDWNRSFGNANYHNGYQTSGWYWRILRPQEISWYVRLREDPAFDAKARARWRELRKDVFSPAKINALVDQYAEELKEAQQRNFQRWPILGQQVTCNHFVGSTYEEEVDWLKSWIGKRIAWIDKQVVGQMPDNAIDGTNVE